MYTHILLVGYQYIISIVGCSSLIDAFDNSFNLSIHYMNAFNFVLRYHLSITHSFS